MDHTPHSETDETGTLRALRKFFAAGAAYASARLRLAALEGKDAALHVFKLVLFLLIALVLAIFGYLFIGYALVLLLAMLIGGDHGQLWGALILGGVHLGGAVFLIWRARANLVQPMFPLTTEEFKKDKTWLEPNPTDNP